MSIFSRSKKAPGADRINVHQRSIINSSEVSVVFYKDTIFHKPSGTLLVNSRKHELHNEIIRFSIVSLGPARELTPALLATIFDQAMEAGFDPISLVSYKGCIFDECAMPPVDMIDSTKSALAAMREYPNRTMEIDMNDESLFVMEVLNASSRTNYLFKPSIKGVAPGSFFITPKFLDQVFEAVKAIGLIPGYIYPVPASYDRPVSQSPLLTNVGHTSNYQETETPIIATGSFDRLADEIREGDYSRAKSTAPGPVIAYQEQPEPTDGLHGLSPAAFIQMKEMQERSLGALPSGAQLTRSQCNGEIVLTAHGREALKHKQEQALRELRNETKAQDPQNTQPRSPLELQAGATEVPPSVIRTRRGGKQAGEQEAESK